MTRKALPVFFFELRAGGWAVGTYITTSATEDTRRRVSTKGLTQYA